MKQQYQRIYILDFIRAKMIIKHDVNDKENSDQTQILHFGDIVSCRIENDWKNHHSNTYIYPFKVKLTNKELLLIAKSEDDRTMWIAGFSYAILVAEKIQQIVKDNYISE